MLSGGGRLLLSIVRIEGEGEGLSFSAFIVVPPSVGVVALLLLVSSLEQQKMESNPDYKGIFSN